MIDVDGELTPTDPARPPDTPATRAGLGAEAQVFAEELDQLGSKVNALTDATRD